MGLFDLFRSRDKPAVQDHYTSGPLHLPFYTGIAESGKFVNQREAMQLTAVRRCIQILSESIASLPLHLYQEKDAGGKQKAVDHPLYSLLYLLPNEEMTSFSFRETMMQHLLLWGNAYAQKIYNGLGELIALYPLMPQKMDVQRGMDGKIYYVYTKTPDEAGQGDKETIVMTKHEVFHIPGMGFDGLVGYSPIAMARNSLGMSLATEEYGSKFFANGASPSGVLEHPGVLKDPEKVREAWNRAYRGSNNANKIAVLEEGMKYTPISVNPDEAQFLETRKFQIDEIARIFGVPPHMIGDLEKSSFNNIEQQSLEFVKYTLNPWVCRWEQAVTVQLLTRDERKQGYYPKFNIDGLLRGDYESRMNGYAVGRQNGWMSANDIRRLENLDPIPASEGGDDYLINGNMTKLKDAGIFAGTQNGGADE